MLVNNQLFREIASKLAYRLPEVEAIDVIRGNPVVQSGALTNDRGNTNLAGIYGEVCVRLALEKICRGKNVHFDAIPHGENAGEFTFRYNRYGRMEVHGNSGVYSEIDEILKVDGMPALIEVKLVNGHNKSSGGPSGRGVVQAMSRDRVKCVTQPVREYFGCDCAYAIVIFQNQLVERYRTRRVEKIKDGVVVRYKTVCVEKERALEHFGDIGGVVIPHWASSSKEYSHEVSRVARYLREKGVHIAA